MCACVLSCNQFFALLWTVACQAPLSMGIFQARILEWVAMPSSRESSRPRGGTCVSCIFLPCQADSLSLSQLEAPNKSTLHTKRNICPMRLDSRSQLTGPGMGGSKPLNVSLSQMGRPHHCSIEPLVVLTTAWLCFIKESAWPLSGPKFFIFQQPPLERTVPKFQFGEC